MTRWKISWAALLREAAQKWLADNCLRLGASVSYCTLFSIFPLILVILAIVQALLQDSTAARELLLDALAQVTGGFRDEFVATLEAVQSAGRPPGIVGAALLLLGASWVFGELVSAFNVIWGVEAPGASGLRAWARTTFFSFALVLASAFLLLVSMVVSALLTIVGGRLVAAMGGGPIWALAQLALNLAVLTLIFAVLLKYLPQAPVAWGDVWLAAGLTALTWSALQGVIGLVIGWSNYPSYGAIGAILALVAWVYSSSQILFFGAEFSVVFARRYGSRRGAPGLPALTSPEAGKAFPGPTSKAGRGSS
jgi:membrane protein